MKSTDYYVIHNILYNITVKTVTLLENEETLPYVRMRTSIN